MRQYHEPQILDDSDDDFDPKTEDINQYCSIIGLDPAKDPELLWIAQEGILAKLEPPWKAINQADVGLYYFNFETGDSLWEHPNDQFYRQKVKTEREKLRKRNIKREVEIVVPAPSATRSEWDSENESSLDQENYVKFLKTPQSSSTTVSTTIQEETPKLAPVRTPRSQTDPSVSNSLEFLKSSNDFNMAKKPVLGAPASLGTSESEEEDDDSRSENIQLDINDLQPVVSNDSKREKLTIDEPTESDSDSFAVGAKQFIKQNPKEVSEKSLSEVSKSTSKSSKSLTKSITKSSSKSSSRKQPTKQHNQPLPAPVRDQIETKRSQLTADIEAEMKKVQMELHRAREERYAEIMGAHEEELYRLEKEAHRVGTEAESNKKTQIEAARARFDREMEEAIQREKTQHALTMEAALTGLRASHTKEREATLAREGVKLASELAEVKRAESAKVEARKEELKRQIEEEEQKAISKMEDDLLNRKHENERVMEQDKRMFNVLREERAKLEKRNKEELLKLQEEHNARRQRLLAANNLELRELEKAHVAKLSEAHLKFEAELTAKRKELEAKRGAFDAKIEKWEKNHQKTKMAWAENSAKRINEREEELHRQSIRKVEPPSTTHDDIMTRKDLDESGGGVESETAKTPASERLRQYLKGLEKKLENVSTMIDHTSIESRRVNQTAQRANIDTTTSNGYVSDRWRAYYGTDFKYIPAKQELEQRTINDYRYKTHRGDMVRTSSY